MVRRREPFSPPVECQLWVFPSVVIELADKFDLRDGKCFGFRFRWHRQILTPVAVLKRKHPRPRLTAFDKLFWVFARKYWPRLKQVLIPVRSEPEF